MKEKRVNFENQGVRFFSFFFFLNEENLLRVDPKNRRRIYLTCMKKKK